MTSSERGCRDVVSANETTSGGEERALLDAVVRRYLSSHNFNGTPAIAFDERAVASVRTLIDGGKLTIVFGDRHPNPHIKAFAEESPKEQIAKLTQLGLRNACLYPSRTVLAERVDRVSYDGKPYALQLALGAAQLEVRYFDLAVLERYRTDPRFHYSCNDVGGRFSVTSEATEKAYAAERDQAFIQDFGFAYNEQYHRAAAAFLRYLADLTPEHQQFWKTHELNPKEWSPHPGWWAASMGEWQTRVPLFHAFIRELQMINSMCRAIGWPQLFRNDFPDETRPREFAFILRPTRAAFDNFVHLLDKIMSENLSKDFFAAQGIELERDIPRADGKTVVQPKATVYLLQEWFAENFQTPQPELIERLIATFKDVRKLRQKPAHAVGEDNYDPVYFERQRDLMLRAYEAVRLIRQAFAHHPSARGVKVPAWLSAGDIYPF